MTAHARALSVRRAHAPSERNDKFPRAWVFERPVFSLSIAFVVGLVMGAVTKA